jgi:bifunctional UDP-N-acetylglucosamine pyrophosphorylase/glucosamine-1-phosphate N-acetyltransferase
MSDSGGLMEIVAVDVSQGAVRVTAEPPPSVIVLAAGGGTRMKSAKPKMLHEICGLPLLGHVLSAVTALQPTSLVVVIGHGRDHVGPYVEQAEPSAVLAVQDEQLGTGHAVQVGLAAVPQLTGTVVVTTGDTPLLTTDTLKALVAQHDGRGHAVTVLTGVAQDASGYGRVLRDREGQVAQIVEHRDATPAQREITEFNSSIYAFDVDFLRKALGILRPDNDQAELYLTDVVEIARDMRRTVGAHHLDDVWQIEGVNDRIQLARLGAEMNRRILDAHMRAGVTVVDPASTWVDVSVTLERDTTLLPGVHLQGATSVAAGAMVGPDTTLVDVTVGAGARIIRTHGSGSVVGAAAVVGPFAYLRPGTLLGARGKIGTFVEVKNSQIGEGSKIPHLSYIGDTSIGEQTNIGAGSITANYDGQAKHRTAIGSHCHTGSDNVFVAPVEVGDGAVTGAGTVVRRNVPPGALAVSTGPQRHLDDWVARKRPGTPGDAAAKRAKAADGSATEGTVQ